MSDIDAQSIKALVGIVGSAAPTLAALLSGDAAPIALAALGRSLLGDAQAAPADIVAAARNASDETRLKVLAAEQSCHLRMRESGVTPDVVNAPASERASPPAVTTTNAALNRQIDSHDHTARNLAYATTAAFVGILILLIFFGANVPEKNILYTLLGVLGTGWANVVGYYFGSSAGSAQKTQALMAAAATQAAPAVR